MSSRYKELSYPVNTATPMYGSAPGPEIIPFRRIADGDTSNSYMISIHNHTGTHIDAPRHFFENGKPISSYSSEELRFDQPLMIDCPKDSAALITNDDIKHASDMLQNSDIVFLRTGFGRFRNDETYRTHNPGISPETILWIRKEFPGVRCIGIDCISISSFQHRNEGREAHRSAFIEKPGFGDPLLLIEDMKLDMLPEERLETVFVLPWQIVGLDSAPCIIMAKIN